MMCTKKNYRIFLIVLASVLVVCAVVVEMISGGRLGDSAATGEGDTELTETTELDTAIDVIEFDDLRDMATYEQN